MISFNYRFYIIPLTALLAYFIYKAYFFEYSDFAAYYFGSEEILKGNYQTTYNTYLLNLSIFNKGYKNIFTSYTPFTPFTALVYSPFLGLKIESAKLLFNIITSGLFIFTIYRAFRFFAIPAWLLFVLPILFFIPLKNNLNFGQSYLLLVTLLIEGFIALKRKNLILSSILWGIAILFKVFPVLILFYLLFKKEYKAASYLTISCVLLLAVSIFIIGYQPWHLYIQLLPRLNEGELNNSFTPQFQSFFMFVKNLFVYDKLLNPHPVLSNQTLFVLSNVFFKALIIASVVAATFNKNIKNLTAFSVWITASLLISPNGSTYSLILLLMLFLGAMSADISNQAKIFLSILIFITCNIPVHYFLSKSLFFQFPRLYFMLLLFIALLIVTKTRFTIKQFGVLVLLFGLLSLPAFFKKTDEGEYLLSKEKHILIHDVSAIGGKLAYSYWSKEGPQPEITDKTVSSVTTNGLQLIDNQVYYYNKKLTNSADWKKTPILINNEEIIYLSDKNRGIGFYTIRTLRLQ
jgi:hypothetical protein